MSLSFYEPKVNTAHVNDILTQTDMNYAFEFTLMPEVDPSQHPFYSPSSFLLLLVPPLPGHAELSETWSWFSDGPETEGD